MVVAKQNTFSIKIARTDQVTRFRGKFNEGYFCINTVQLVHFAFKSSAMESFFQKVRSEGICSNKPAKSLKNVDFVIELPIVFARFLRHLGFLYMGSLALGIRQQSRSTISMQQASIGLHLGFRQI